MSAWRDIAPAPKDWTLIVVAISLVTSGVLGCAEGAPPAGAPRDVPAVFTELDNRCVQPTHPDTFDVIAVDGLVCLRRITTYDDGCHRIVWAQREACYPSRSMRAIRRCAAARTEAYSEQMRFFAALVCSDVPEAVDVDLGMQTVIEDVRR